MIDAHLLIEITSDEKGESSMFVPVENVDNLSLGVMIDRLESHGRWKIDLPLEKQYNDNWRKALELRRRYLTESRELLLKDL